jgi:hypothetical protein
MQYSWRNASLFRRFENFRFFGFGKREIRHNRFEAAGLYGFDYREALPHRMPIGML